MKKYQNDLSQKQKNLEVKLFEFENKFVKSFQKFESNWRNWKTDDICQWIKALDDHKFVGNFCVRILFENPWQKSILQFVLDSILYIDPILERDEIDGLIIEKKRICEDFVKKYILIGEPNKLGVFWKFTKSWWQWNIGWF